MSRTRFNGYNYTNEVNYTIKYKDGGVSHTNLRAYYKREKIGDQYGNQNDNQYKDQYEQYPGSHGDQYIDTPYYGKIKNPYANDPDNDYIYYDNKGNAYTFYEVKTLRKLHPAYIHGYIDIEGNDILQYWDESEPAPKKKEKKINPKAIAFIVVASLTFLFVAIAVFYKYFDEIRMLINKRKQKKNTKENTNKNTNENKTNDALLDAYNKAVMETPYDPYNNVPTVSYEPDNTSTITYEATHNDMDNYTENIAETNNTIETVT